MLESIRSHRRWLMFFLLVLVFLSFVVTGIYGYNRFVEGGNAVARVAGAAITPQELDNAQRQRLEELREMFGSNFDPKLFDTPEARANTLELLINQRLLSAEAAAENMRVSDQHLHEVISAIPAFQQDGKFSYERYQQLLRSQARSEAGFESEVRQGLLRQSLLQSVAESALLPAAVLDRVMRIGEEQRDVRELRFNPAEFAGKVSVSEAQIKAYYDENRLSFEMPESVRAEYVLLTLDDVGRGIKLAEPDLRVFYEQNKGRFGIEEQRRASHILFTVGADGTARDKAGARQVAEQVLAQARAKPAEFDKLARQHSKDPGSAANGGDLGFFGRNMMVKPFEDAAFALKQGEISELVESDFGFHIIRLTGVRPADAKPFEQVRSEIEQELRRQQAQKRFTEAAEAFTNTVYEQADSLKPVAEKLKLQVQTVDTLSRGGIPARPGTPQVLTPKVVQALFAEESIRTKRNTEVIEVAPNALLAARVVEHRPAKVRPLEEVSQEVKVRLLRREAIALARAAAQSRMEALGKTPSDTGFGAVKTVSRQQTEGLPPTAVTAIMRVPAEQLPTYVLAEADGGAQVVFRVLAAKAPAVGDARVREQARQRIAREVGAADDAAFLQALRARHDTEIVSAELRALSQPPKSDAKKAQ
jgi:peptidyl-prolyl cis-trans isomerase D